ncbi:MAG: glycosyltransferase [Patescibacteria group bacterium]
MKIAIVHDSLVEFGGAERVLQTLLTLFPEASLYTAYYDRSLVEKFFSQLSPSHFHYSWAQNTPLSTHGSLFQFFSPLVWRSFDFSDYDLVISSTGYLLANLVKVGSIHVQYVHTLPKNLFKIEPPYPFQKLTRYEIIMRQLSQRAFNTTPYIIANSKYTQTMLKTHVGVKASVIYPPVKIPKTMASRRKPEYYLCVSRLDPPKSLELAIVACSRLGLPLKVVGNPTDKEYESFLRSLAGPTVEFLGFCSDAEVSRLYESAIAFLFTSKNEDFGIAPVEAMAHGVPVIAYYGGGVKESLAPGKTGVFFYEHTAQALAAALQKFDPRDFDPRELYHQAKKFSQSRFTGEIKAYLEQAVSRRLPR